MQHDFPCLKLACSLIRCRSTDGAIIFRMRRSFSLCGDELYITNNQIYDHFTRL